MVSPQENMLPATELVREVIGLRGKVSERPSRSGDMREADRQEQEKEETGGWHFGWGGLSLWQELTLTTQQNVIL